MMTDKEIALTRAIAELRVENHDLQLRIIELENVVAAVSNYMRSQSDLSLLHAQTALEVLCKSSKSQPQN